MCCFSLIGCVVYVAHGEEDGSFNPDGHVNWKNATYTGKVQFESWDTSPPLGDDDINIRIYGPKFGNTSYMPGGTRNNPDNIKGEFNAVETVYNFFPNSDWWQKFTFSSFKEDLIKDREAVMTGLVGIDTFHTTGSNANKSEIHPVHAFAIRIAKDEDIDPHADGWAFFARNWGNEGYCGPHDHPPEPRTQNDLISIRLTRPRNTDCGGCMPVLNKEKTHIYFGSETANGFKEYSEARELTRPEAYYDFRPSGDYVVFTFPLSDPTSRDYFYGELYVNWLPGINDNPGKTKLHTLEKGLHQNPAAAEEDGPDESAAARAVFEQLSPTQMEAIKNRITSALPLNGGLSAPNEVTLGNTPLVQSEFYDSPLSFMGPARRLEMITNIGFDALCTVTAGVTPAAPRLCMAANAVHLQTDTFVSYSEPTASGDSFWLRYKDVNFEDGTLDKFVAFMTAETSGNTVEVHLDGPVGVTYATLITQKNSDNMDDLSTLSEQYADMKSAIGVHDVYLVFRGPQRVGNFAWFAFRRTRPPIAIAEQPTDVTTCLGSTTNFSVTATGNSLTYQWFKNGSPIPGANRPALTISPLSLADVGAYSVVISDEVNNTIRSREAQLAIAQPPKITTQPVSTGACVGQSVQFSVAASGTGLTYQWLKNGASIAGATDSAFNIRRVTAADAGTYSVLVGNSCGVSVSSATATLTASDGAVTITRHPLSTGVCVGQSVTLTVAAVGSGLRYQWRKDGANIAGATAPTLTIPSVNLSDTGSYSVLVYNGCNGVQSANATVLINGPIQITMQPASVAKSAGESVTFAVTATGSRLRYQWRKNGGNIAGATGSSLTISSVDPTDAGSYSAVVYNGCSTVYSASATLTVLASTNVAPTADSVLPNSGSSLAQTFTLKYSDGNGYRDLSTVRVFFNGSTTTAPICAITYYRATNFLELLDDQFSPLRITPGTASVSNSQCTLNGAQSSISGAGNTLTLNLALTFSRSFAGMKTIAMHAADAAGAVSGWQNRGVWTVP